MRVITKVAEGIHDRFCSITWRKCFSIVAYDRRDSAIYGYCPSLGASTPLFWAANSTTDGRYWLLFFACGWPYYLILWHGAGSSELHWFCALFSRRYSGNSCRTVNHTRTRASISRINGCWQSWCFNRC